MSQHMPQRLRAARASKKMTQQQVADAVDMKRTHVALIETGKRHIKDHELSKLAELYGRSKDWLTGDIEEGEDTVYDELGLIANIKVLSEEDKDAIADAMNSFGEAYRLGNKISVDTQTTYPPSYNLDPPSSIGQALAEGEYYAEIERRRLGMGHAPIGDMVDFIMDQDIWFSMTDLDEDVSGIFINDKKLGMAVITNSAEKSWDSDADQLDKPWLHYVAQRLSVAHQYSHTLFARNQGGVISTKSGKDEKTEQRANAFAGAFLLPKLGLDEELRRIGKGQATRTLHMGMDLVTGKPIERETRRTSHSQEIGLHDAMFVANRFGVSYNLAVIRLASLGYIKLSIRDVLIDKGEQLRNRAHGYSKLIRNQKRGQGPDMRSLAKSRLHKTMANFAIEARRIGAISEKDLREYARTICKDADELIRTAKFVKDTKSLADARSRAKARSSQKSEGT